MKNPTVDKIIKERGLREMYYGTLHEIQRTDDDFYELVYDAHIPDKLGYTQKTPKTAREWVETGVRHFTMDNPRAIVPAEGRSDAAKQRAAILETFYNAWLEKMIIQLKQGVRKELKRGEVFLKLWIDDRYYAIDTSPKDYNKEETEDMALTYFPLITTLPDPINVFCSPAHNGLQPVDVIEYYDMTVSEVENLCERNGWTWTNKDNKESTKTVKWTSYYDDKYRCFLVDDEPILKTIGAVRGLQTNILGFCPYIHIPSGLGDTSYEGKPEYQYRSIIYPQRDMIELWTRALNQADAITAKFAWPVVKIHGTSEAAVKALFPDGVLKIDPDKPIIDTEDAQVTFEQGQATPPQVYQHLAMLQEQAEPSPVLGGRSPSGVYSGTHFQSELSQAKPQYKDPLKNFEDGLSEFLGLGARAIDKVIKHSISVRGGKGVKQIGPDDIKGYYYVKVAMQAELPEATDMRKNMGENYHKSNILPLREVHTKYFDYSDEEAEDLEAEMVKERFLSNPVVEEAVVRMFAERWKMDEVTKILDEMGMEQQRGGSRRQPEVAPPGIATIPSRGRTSPEMQGKAELGTLATPQRT